MDLLVQTVNNIILLSHNFKDHIIDSLRKGTNGEDILQYILFSCVCAFALLPVSVVLLGSCWHIPTCTPFHLRQELASRSDAKAVGPAENVPWKWGGWQE